MSNFPPAKNAAMPGGFSTPQFTARRAVESRKPQLYSDDLFRNGENEVLIEHQGECYRLRLTRLGKLILNK